MSNIITQPLHQSHVLNLRATLNKIYSFSHFLALIPIFYYRASFFILYKSSHPKYCTTILLLPWLIIFAAEILASFIWLLRQPLLWRPLVRTAFTERLPKDEELPGIDVFICTADPKREPTFDVMNTVISAMALDYPKDKLGVYVSDDGGASVTLNGMKEAWVFATWWLPFVRRYNIKTVCPRAYFELPQEVTQSVDFLHDRNMVKDKFERFECRVRGGGGGGEGQMQKDNEATDHPALVQVVDESSAQKDAVNPEVMDMPFLVYIAREKRPSQPHSFKAGALNVLLRVSSTMTNSPYILVLDCDMYCNGPTSARQAMCFHLDPKLSSSLGWVQFPHKFHNISETDIYDSQMRLIWPLIFPGMDGVQGCVLGGTNFYIKRQALYGLHSSDDIKVLKSFCGSSNEFIKSLSEINKLDESIKGRKISSVSVQEAHFLASCTYERDTKWGEKVGFRYKSVVEDVMTGVSLQSQGWKSVYLNPTTTEFLGSATTNLNDLLTQGSRWTAGLLQIGLSKHNPFCTTPSKMNILQKMVASWITLFPLEFIIYISYAVFPPICFFYGIPLYPSVSDPLFIPFAFVFISSNVKHLLDVIFIGKGSVNSWMNEERITMIKGLTCYVFGALEFAMEKMGIRQAMFIPTNKAGEEDTTKWYQMGIYDFRAPDMILVPLLTSVTLNMVCFVAGVVRSIYVGNSEEMVAQTLLSLFVLVMSFPIINGMVLRTDGGRVPFRACLMSTLLSMFILGIGYFILRELHPTAL